MFLSIKAKQLLDQGLGEQLKSLPLEELLDDESLKHFKGGKLEAPVSADSSSHSFFSICPSIVRDRVLFTPMMNPVVISSGHIFDRQVVIELFRNNPHPFCPHTNQPIQLDTIIDLPQLAAAIAVWKRENAQEEPLALSLIVSGNKIRLDFKGEQTILTDYLSATFEHQHNRIGDVLSYSLPDWSVAWQTRDTFTRVEMWFPIHALEDAEINSIITATLTPLALPQDEQAINLPTSSVKNLQPRTYVTAVDALPASHADAKECCQAFLDQVSQLRSSRFPGRVFIDAVISSDVPARNNRVDLGVRAIGSALPAGSSIFSLPTNQTSSSVSSLSSHPTSVMSTQSSQYRIT